MSHIGCHCCSYKIGFGAPCRLLNFATAAVSLSRVDVSVGRDLVGMLDLRLSIVGSVPSHDISAIDVRLWLVNCFVI